MNTAKYGKRRRFRQRMWAAMSLLILVPLGFYSKLGYAGPAEGWVHDSLGGALYVLFWCLVLFSLFPGARPRVIAGSVFTVTCLLECLQLWHPPLLEAIRGTFIGRTLIGTCFVGSDFLYYVLGSLAGWLWIRRLNRTDAPDREGSMAA